MAILRPLPPYYALYRYPLFSRLRLCQDYELLAKELQIVLTEIRRTFQ